MAHLIDLSNARNNMAFVGQTPWHGLGQKLSEGAPIETWAIEAGMAHTIERSRAVFRWGPGKGEVGTVDGKHVLWRSDNKVPLSVVSDKYKIVQPREILEFYRDLVESTGDYQLETAGCLDDGRKYWALAKYRENLAFGADVVNPYLLLASSADGTMATIAQHTSIRVVCNNTLQMSLHGSGRDGIVRVPHNTTFDANAVKSQLDTDSAIKEYKQDISDLINKTITRAQAAEVFVGLMAKRDDQGSIVNEKSVKKIVGEIMGSLLTSPGANMETTHDTAWGAMNAITHYVDFKAGSRSQNNRFSSAQFGAGAALKQRAFEALIAA